MKYVIAAVLLAVAGCALPDLLHAIQISRQKRTMADMRTIATKIEEHAPLSSLARADGWGTPFEISIRGNDYSIRSYGSDHRRDAKLLDGPHTGFWRDIVLTNGSFVAYPDGI